MNYQEKLLDRITHNEKWPEFDKLNFLTDLNIVADDVHAKKTIEGYLAALLIYHQLCEEMVKKLIECSNFFIQCATFPNEIKTINLKNKMFGQLLKELKRGAVNKKIKTFIKKCENLNALRIRMVHKITLKTSITDISKQSKSAKKYFDDILDLFNIIHDEYRVTFHEYNKNHEDWIELMNDNINMNE